MRNPHGHRGEWNGAWSDDSDEWKNNQHIKNQLTSQGYKVESKDDGIFWMEINDFINNVDDIGFNGPFNSW